MRPPALQKLPRRDDLEDRNLGRELDGRGLLKLEFELLGLRRLEPRDDAAKLAQPLAGLSRLFAALAEFLGLALEVRTEGLPPPRP